MADFLFHPREVGARFAHNDLKLLSALIGSVRSTSVLSIMTRTRYNHSVYYVYILQSTKRTNWLYKGSTFDLKRRVAEHNAGKNFSTAPYIPLKLVYYEAYILKSDAEAREKYLKTSMGMRVIKKQLSNYLKSYAIGNRG